LLEANAVVVLPDGRIVAGGDDSGDGLGGFGLVRYLENGELDPTFGGDGVVTTILPQGDGVLLALVAQPDGRMVAAGWSNGGYVLARYLVDGTLDPSFGDGGLVATSFGPGRHGASALTIQPDGMLVAAGQAGSRHCQVGIVRYQTDGELDPTFGDGGSVRTSLGLAGCERASEVRVQSDGKIVAVGGTTSDLHSRLVVLRYLSNGEPDVSFGDGGVVTTDVSSFHDWAYGLVIQPSGRLVAAGISGSDFLLARYLA
jgi:uncharacterized delta-60 repeat protein